MRPIIVSILAILIILVGLLFIVIGIIGLIGSAALFYSQFQNIAPLTAVFSAILLVVGLILLVSGLGLWRLQLWAWALALIVVIFSLIGEVGRYAVERGTFSTFSFILEVVLLIYLLAVRKHFT